MEKDDVEDALGIDVSSVLYTWTEMMFSVPVPIENALPGVTTNSRSISIRFITIEDLKETLADKITCPSCRFP